MPFFGGRFCHRWSIKSCGDHSSLFFFWSARRCNLLLGDCACQNSEYFFFSLAHTLEWLWKRLIITIRMHHWTMLPLTLLRNLMKSRKWQTILNASFLMMTTTMTCKTVGSLHIHLYVYARWREDEWQSWPPPSFPDIGASKSLPLKLDWEELNWANLCLPSNSRSNFLRWEALIDKEILPSTLHRSHSPCDPERGIQPWLRAGGRPACSEPSNRPWRSILEEGDEFNYPR